MAAPNFKQYSHPSILNRGKTELNMTTNEKHHCLHKNNISNKLGNAYSLTRCGQAFANKEKAKEAHRNWHISVIHCTARRLTLKATILGWYRNSNTDSITDGASCLVALVRATSRKLLVIRASHVSAVPESRHGRKIVKQVQRVSTGGRCQAAGQGLRQLQLAGDILGTRPGDGRRDVSDGRHRLLHSVHVPHVRQGH